MQVSKTYMKSHFKTEGNHCDHWTSINTCIEEKKTIS